MSRYFDLTMENQIALPTREEQRWAHGGTCEPTATTATRTTKNVHKVPQLTIHNRTTITTSIIHQCSHTQTKHKKNTSHIIATWTNTTAFTATTPTTTKRQLQQTNTTTVQLPTKCLVISSWLSPLLQAPVRNSMSVP